MTWQAEGGEGVGHDGAVAAELLVGDDEFELQEWPAAAEIFGRSGRWWGGGRRRSGAWRLSTTSMMSSMKPSKPRRAGREERLAAARAAAVAAAMWWRVGMGCRVREEKGSHNLKR